MSAGWAKLHNDLWSSRKWMTVSLAAQGLWTSAVAYSNSMQTYGRIDGHLLPLFRGAPDLAEELVSAGLWDTDGDGWMIHDWDDHQTSRERAEATRAVRAEAGRRGGKSTSRRRVTERSSTGDATPEKQSDDLTIIPVTSDDEQIAKQNQANGSKVKQEEEEEEEKQLLPPYPQTGTQTALLEAPSPAPSRKRSGASVYPDAFEEFWSAWPKAGDSKAATLKAWTKATRGTSRLGARVAAPDLLEAVRSFAEDPNIPPNTYIRSASRWLNEDGWTDGPLPARGGGRPSNLDQTLDVVAQMHAARAARQNTQQIAPPATTPRRIA